MDDGGAGIYRQFANEEAADRRRLGWGLVLAVVVHGALLVLPLGWWGGGEEAVTMPPVPGETFLLRALRFAPPEPPAATPVMSETDAANIRPEPPAPARAEILVPPGPAGDLVPPQPLRIPPPRSLAALWERGLGAEVRLTLVVDVRGEVAEATVEEVRLRHADGGEGGVGNEAGEAPELSAGQRRLLGEVAVEAVEGWRFLPATLQGNPIALGIGVVVIFPAPEAVPGGAVPGANAAATTPGSG